MGGNHGTLEGTNYSSPVPILGSLVCMLMILYDVILAFQARKRWLPCKSFTLNPITLILLSIASKFPVDLTTTMSSPQDQLSKLSAITFICVCTGFLMPSLGIFSKSQCFPNLVAMTIFSLAIVANICIQLSTGVIVLFFTEHIVILCCILLMLMFLWYGYWDISNQNRSSSEINKQVFIKLSDSMATRVSRSYEYSYHSNPQLVLCLEPICVAVAILCLVCSVVLIQAALRSVVLKQSRFCSGVSDCDWSIWEIDVIQILTVALGSFVTLFRWLALSKHMDCDFLFDNRDQETDDVIDKIPILGVALILDKYWMKFRNFFIYTVLWLLILIAKYPRMLASYISSCTDHSDYVSRGSVEWTLRKSREDSERVVNAGKSESAKRLSQLISSRKDHPSQQAHPYQNGGQVSSLSLVLLIRIAQVSVPNDLCESLVKSYEEVREIIQFIDKIINSNKFQFKDKLLLAKAVWAGDDFRVLLPGFGFVPPTAYDQSRSNLDGAVSKLKDLYDHSDDLESAYLGIIVAELGTIVDFINHKPYSSVQDLSTSMEKVFVEMVRVLLAPLPVAIFTYLSESPDEEYEDRVKRALKLVYKVEPLDDQIPWLFPAGYNFSGTIFCEASVIQSEVDVAEGDEDDVPRNIDYVPVQVV